MAEIEWWWVLVISPLFFGLGWMAARIDIKHLLSESRRIPRAYFRGLNHLLNDQPEKAIESFVEVTKLDSQAVEVNFALGSLFRRQGEFEQAIRIHRNLLERTDLDRGLSSLINHELGLDYFEAGLWDRAEKHLGLVVDNAFTTTAQECLLQIYEQEKDWFKAIAARRALETSHKKLYTKEIAQYYCELAVSAIMDNDLAGAIKYAELALAENRKSARAYIVLGDIAQMQGRLQEAVSYWKQVESKAPDFIGLVAGRLVQVYKNQQNIAEVLRLLKVYHQQYPSLDLFDTLFHLTLEEANIEGATELVQNELQINPSLVVLDKWLDIEILTGTDSRKNTLEVLKAVLYQYVQRLGVYRCQQCGFRAKQYYWKCPGCNSWGSYPPQRLDVLE